MKVNVLVLACSALVLGACSSTPDAVRDATRVEKAAAKRVERTINQTPGWYLQPERSTPEVVFTTGTALSSDLSMSRSKALLNAQGALGDQLNAVMSSMTKQYMRDTGVDTTVTIEDTEQVMRKLTNAANVAGYRVEKEEVYPDGRYFRTYVMLSYPIGAANTIRQQQEHARMMQNMPEQKAKAYDELDQLIQNTRDR